jgi:hypothetical protein
LTIIRENSDFKPQIPVEKRLIFTTWGSETPIFSAVKPFFKHLFASASSKLPLMVDFIVRRK